MNKKQKNQVDTQGVTRAEAMEFFRNGVLDKNKRVLSWKKLQESIEEAGKECPEEKERLEEERILDIILGIYSLPRQKRIKCGYIWVNLYGKYLERCIPECHKKQPERKHFGNIDLFVDTILQWYRNGDIENVTITGIFKRFLPFCDVSPYDEEYLLKDIRDMSNLAEYDPEKQLFEKFSEYKNRIYLQKINKKEDES